MAKVTHEFDLYGKHYVLETGELAKQATGACLVKCGDSTVLLTAVVSKERKDYDFFPLTVDFIEKMYAVGRIPGGYLKREARPSEKATLTARMIDRPLRPSFPAGFRNEVQVVATTLVADQINPVDTICIMAASAALTVGGVPFEGPLACVRIGRDRDTHEFIVNPTYEERDNSDLDLELGGAEGFISMLEAGAEEISEEDMLAAMAFGQEAIAAFCAEQKKFFDKVREVNGEFPVREYILDEPIPEVHDRVFAHYDEMEAALKDADKLSRIGKVEALKAAIKAEFTEEEQAQWSRAIPVELKSLEKHAMRLMVVETGERVDGRTPTEVRPLMVKGDYLPRVHGSGLFQRGQTQVLSICTLGMLNEWQRLDTIEPVDGKRYMHHYNFPPFCTGETGRMGSPKRREIGHGNLAERALLPVIPSEDEFPYTIRVVSEVMESNGSSSMGSTCGSTLALMDAGVPIKRPVSGVAMGLIQEEGKTVVLTDIQGLEDFLGDMDFKVTGTTKGITAHADGQQGHRPHAPRSCAPRSCRRTRAACSSSTPCSTRLPLRAREDQGVRAADHQPPDPHGQDPRRHRLRRQGHPRHPGGHRRHRGHPGGRHRLHRGRRRRRRRGCRAHQGHRQGPRGGGGVHRPRRGHPALRRLRRASARQGRPAPHLPARVAQGRVDKVEDVLNIGDEVKVRVLEVDEKGKISLDRIDKPEAPAGSGHGRSHEGGEKDRGHREHRGPRRRPGDNGGDERPRPRRHPRSVATLTSSDA